VLHEALCLINNYAQFAIDNNYVLNNNTKFNVVVKQCLETDSQKRYKLGFNSNTISFNITDGKLSFVGIDLAKDCKLSSYEFTELTNIKSDIDKLINSKMFIKPSVEQKKITVVEDFDYISRKNEPKKITVVEDFGSISRKNEPKKIDNVEKKDAVLNTKQEVIDKIKLLDLTTVITKQEENYSDVDINSSDDEDNDCGDDISCGSGDIPQEWNCDNSDTISENEDGDGDENEDEDGDEDGDGDEDEITTIVNKLKEQHKKDMAEYDNYLSELNNQKTLLRKAKDKSEQKMKIYESDKNSYCKINANIKKILDPEEQKLAERNISPLFKQKYPIFKYMEDNNLLNTDGEFDVYCELFDSMYNSLGETEYISDIHVSECKMYVDKYKNTIPSYEQLIKEKDRIII